ncbi:hypothetical protein [uncultured Clostridium sp.]|uniref:hypothetical protein n=1 Tax=uncultured Clostridium sp. TaxID=59620 RepID=UPI0025D834B6|nr:hypothetical protein [uncultured Clostridium sp.]
MYCHNNPVNKIDESGYLPKWLKKAAKVVKKAVSKVVKKVKAVVKIVKNKVVSSYKNVKNTVRNYASVIKNSIKQTSKNVASAVKQTGSNLINKGKNFVSSTTESNIISAVQSGMDTGLGYLKTGSKFETKVKVAGPIGIGTTAVGVLLNFEEGFTEKAILSSVVDLGGALLGFAAGAVVGFVLGTGTAAAIGGVVLAAAIGWGISVGANIIKEKYIS